jgi:hypothetical protein
VKNSKHFHHFVSSRWKIQKEAQKRWKRFEIFTTFFSEKCLKNKQHFSP